MSQPAFYYYSRWYTHHNHISGLISVAVDFNGAKLNTPQRDQVTVWKLIYIKLINCRFSFLMLRSNPLEGTLKPYEITSQNTVSSFSVLLSYWHVCDTIHYQTNILLLLQYFLCQFTVKHLLPSGYFVSMVNCCIEYDVTPRRPALWLFLPLVLI